METSGEINDLGFSPSFNCYSDDNPTSTAATKVSREVKEEEDFEFSSEFSGEQFSANDLALEGRILFPIFNTNLVTKDEVVDHDDSSNIIPLQKLLPIDSEEAPPSFSSSESEDASSGTFCVTWLKSRSTGSEESGSRRWRINKILRRSNSLGKESVFLCPKTVEASCKKGVVKSGEGPKGTAKMKTASFPSIHELFYVQKRAEQEGGKMKSYLPYRQDIFGFKVHINGNSNKKLPF